MNKKLSCFSCWEKQQNTNKTNNNSKAKHQKHYVSPFHYSPSYLPLSLFLALLFSTNRPLPPPPPSFLGKENKSKRVKVGCRMYTKTEWLPKSLTMGMKVVTHTVKWLAPKKVPPPPPPKKKKKKITRAIMPKDSSNLLQKFKSVMGCAEWHAAIHNCKDYCGCRTSALSSKWEVNRQTEWQVQRTMQTGDDIMEADDHQVTTVFTVQPSFHHRHSTNRVSWSVTIVGERWGEVWLHVRRRW